MATPLGSGMASLPAGVGPCGHSDPDALVGALKQTPVAALYFDPFTRTYVQNADFTMVPGTGPIQRAANLLLPLGALPSTRTSGFDVAAVKRAPPNARLTVIEDALRRTWKPLLSTGQISFGTVRLLDGKGNTWESGPWNGQFEVPVYDLITKGDPVALRGRIG